MRIITAFLAIALLGSSCLEFEHEFKVLAPGIWRAQLQLTPVVAPHERRDDALSASLATQGTLPFTFEVFETDSDSIYIEIINGSERIKISDLTFSKNPETTRDSLTIHFPIYDAYIKVEIDGNKMDGHWIVKSKKDYQIPFSARFGRGHRFTTLKKPNVMDISGKWTTHFGQGDESFEAIGVFEQEGNQVSGTFMTETGDFRYLAGTIQADKLYLSTFDGSHAFLFEGKINPVDSTIVGSFLSGKHYKTTWNAKMNPNAKLLDPNSLLSLKDTSLTVHFSLPSPSGKMISLSDAAFIGKPKILQIMGTWCPNCMDEGAFLADYFTKKPNSNVKVIGLAFEKYDNTEKSMEVIRKYHTALKIPYDIVLAGKPNRERIFELFPQFNNFVAYPTLIFLNADNEIVKVHSGFNGPATPNYNKFKAEFEADMKLLEQNSTL